MKKWLKLFLLGILPFGFLNAQEITPDWLNEADSLYLAGEFKKSLSLCNEHLKEIKSEEDLRFLRAKCWFSLGNPLEFFEEIDLITKINPCKHEAYALAGLYLYRQNEFRQARKKYYQAIGCAPKIAEYYFDVGILESKLYKWKSAIDNFNKAIQLKPGYFEAFEARAFARSMSKAYKLAIGDYDSAMAYSKSNPDLLVKRGLCMVSLKQFKEAEKIFSRAIRLDSSKKSSWYSRGRVLLEMHQYQKAMDDFNQVLNLDKEDELALFSKGVCLLELDKRKNLESACDCFKKASEKNLGQAWDFFRQHCTR